MMETISAIRPDDYDCIIFFTGAGMSAESGMHVYRGDGGIWQQYNWEEFACQKAFDKDPGKVLDFHEKRRSMAIKCQPHAGHEIINKIQKSHKNTWVVTQNIDGMHQRAKTVNVLELHGSLWRVKCTLHGIFEDFGKQYKTRRCVVCNQWLRPDIVWFEDMLDQNILQKVASIVQTADLFISIGTSGTVYPAAIYPQIAKQAGATTISINTELPGLPEIYDHILIGKASEVLSTLFIPV